MDFFFFNKIEVTTALNIWDRILNWIKILNCFHIIEEYGLYGFLIMLKIPTIKILMSIELKLLNLTVFQCVGEIFQ